MYRLGVLLSGRGSNFKNILNSIKSGFIKNAEIVVVISNKADANGLNIAKENKIDAYFIDPNGKNREDYDKEVVAKLKDYRVDFVILAGYMRILSSYFIRSFENRILNIHPALLPSFKGLHAQMQALKKGVKFAGATVHFVTEELDDGPIIVQSIVPVFDNDDEESLSARILKTEHKIYPLAVKLLCEDKLLVENGRVKIKNAEVPDENFFITNPLIGGEDGI
ncbi:phosphoribosylglycinamide formyltransferase [Hippea alviniae]|uniref:phosphoribosylglycinamide formyltransferase n=1 Tax=Hippea alviniae TaxID=1279027 RepID=UPI0003B599F3|nr:phosphoribosylglycinamide formyltransferase [Hippea alviniae]